MSSNGAQVLTFALGEEDYCVEIDYVAEIVDGGNLTSIPNAEDYIEGVVDLRGKTTTIINPCKILDTDGVRADEFVNDSGMTQNRIIVLDSESAGADTTTGWLVSDVEEVTTVSEGALEADTVGDSDLLQGLIKDDDGFTIWLDPQELTA